MSEKRGPEQDAVGKAVRWAVVILIIVAIMKNAPKVEFPNGELKISPQTNEASQPVEESASAKAPDKDCSGSPYNNFSLLAMPFMPIRSPAVAVSEIKEGDGDEAVCGQRATLRYAYATPNGEVIYSNLLEGEPTKDVVIGGSEILAGLSRGMIGMKVGGERDITMAPALGFNGVKKLAELRNHDQFKFSASSGIMTARAKLISVKPALPATDLKLRIIDKQMGAGGATVECGDKAYLTLSLWSLDGKLLFSNENGEHLVFTIGESSVPFGIERGVSGMMPGGARTLIIPPAYMRPLNENAKDQLLKDVEIPKDEIVLAVVQLHEAPRPVANQPASEPEKQKTKP